ncbi:MAG: HAD-IC family P-type ATPase [bacterium]|nr:HAD-IC family P-type ATPase [bacterium]
MEADQKAFDLAETSAALLNGLSEQEAAERRRRGQGNNVRIQTGRTYRQILLQNVFTFINTMIFGIGLALLWLGLAGDAAVSVGIVSLNVIVGVVQEFRAKRQLDRIALLTRPKASVIREGQTRTVDPAEIVVGDLIVLHPGDQIIVDGLLVQARRLEVDEALLTGESDPVLKGAGDEVLSGSFCVAGSGIYEAHGVGQASFANRLTAAARQFRVTRTPLQHSMNRLIRLLLIVALGLWALLTVSFITELTPAPQIAQMAAVVAGLVPAGLLLMTATSYALGALRMAGQGALVQQANAVESMSNVTMLCLDKTGTLTTNQLTLKALHPIQTTEQNLRRLVGDYARSTATRNRTSEALIASIAGNALATADEIPFSSARKWSALRFAGSDISGIYVLGAPDTLAPALTEADVLPADLLAEWAANGWRALLLAHSPDDYMLHDEAGYPRLLPVLQPFGLVALGDTLRPEARATLVHFQQAGIALKLISGDHPDTVASLARQAGFPGEIETVTGEALAALNEADFSAAVARASIFGRVSPAQKAQIISALQQQGHYVAMIGDGVNDVLALKQAQVGIALQSGSGAARGVADIILVSDSFGALPRAFLEGQRILNGMRGIVRLFLARVLYAVILIAVITVAALTSLDLRLFPFTPRHNSLLTLLTVGLPTIGLAAWAQAGTPPQSLLRDARRFVLPAGLLTGIMGLGLYGFYLADALQETDPLLQMAAVEEARTVLTTFCILAGLCLVLFVSPPTAPPGRFFQTEPDQPSDRRPAAFALVMLLAFGLVMLLEPLRSFFQLELLRISDYSLIIGTIILWCILLRLILRQRST